MALDRSGRKMPLRQLLAHSEKFTRDLIGYINTSFVPRAVDFRDLSRPIRRKSHYPTIIALVHALQSLDQLSDEVQKQADYLRARLQEIREHAKREQISRR